MQVAIALTVVTLALILPWRENYGGEEGKPLTPDDSDTTTHTATTTATDKTEVDSTNTDATAKKTPKKKATTRKSTQNDDNTSTTTPHKNTPPTATPASTNPPEINALSQTLGQWVVHVAAVMKAHPVILCLGLSQAVFEGAVYTFGESLYVCMCD